MPEPPLCLKQIYFYLVGDEFPILGRSLQNRPQDAIMQYKDIFAST
jgi:hypothetical protein